MSEVIEDYIRRNPGMREGEAFDAFLKQDRIRAWVGTDETRRERLRKEFTRVWAQVNPAQGAPAAPPPPREAPAQEKAPVQTVREEKPVRVEVRREPPAQEAPRAPQVEPVRAPPLAPAFRGAIQKPEAPKPVTSATPMSPVGAPPRRLQLLCSTCGRLDVWSKDGQIECRGCGRHYDNFLDLIPVKPVGTFEYLFGEGAGGMLAAGGLVAGLVALYLLLRFYN